MFYMLCLIISKYSQDRLRYQSEEGGDSGFSLTCPKYLRIFSVVEFYNYRMHK